MQQPAVRPEPLSREAAIGLLEAHEADLRARGVVRLALFGSTARGEARPDSDVDILVEIDWQHPFSLVEWAGLELYLQELFDRRVEVTMRHGLKEHLTDSVLADAEEVFPVLGRRAFEPGGMGMPTRSLRERLLDIRDAIGEIEGFIAGKSFEEFLATSLLRRAVERDIEVVSEASRHITAGLMSRHPAVPWQKVMAIGNVLCHEYEKIQAAVLWGVVTAELPVLRRAIHAMIAEVESEAESPGTLGETS